MVLAFVHNHPVTLYDSSPAGRLKYFKEMVSTECSNSSSRLVDYYWLALQNEWYYGVR